MFCMGGIQTIGSIFQDYKLYIRVQYFSVFLPVRPEVEGRSSIMNKEYTGVKDLLVNILINRSLVSFFCNISISKLSL